VALLAINRLVLRHVRALSNKMETFAERRTFPVSHRTGETAPVEFREINRSFDRMARKIIRDEADLENALYERNVLVREVHHRVKNNLQLMSSIMNMQIRQARSDEARSALKGVQERVTSLATVHRGLYESPKMSEVRIDSLLRDLIGQLQVIGIAREGDIEVELVLEPLVLIPDQAAPLALLTTEAVTNALKYIAPDREGRCRLTVKLLATGDDTGSHELSIANSISPDETGEDDPNSVGLGRRLIDSFVVQVGGRARTEIADDCYRLVVSFVPTPFGFDEAT
jgi:two-component sensor histidine kinase